MIQVDLRSPLPIYEQLYENVRKLILQGDLLEDEQVPSVRELASQLAINPNTIQKAYKALEKDGYIYSVSGRGNYVKALNHELLDQQQEKVIKKLNKALEEAKLIGLSKKNVLRCLDQCYKGENNLDRV